MGGWNPGPHLTHPVLCLYNSLCACSLWTQSCGLVSTQHQINFKRVGNIHFPQIPVLVSRVKQKAFLTIISLSSMVQTKRPIYSHEVSSAARVIICGSSRRLRLNLPPCPSPLGSPWWRYPFTDLQRMRLLWGADHSWLVSYTVSLSFRSATRFLFVS